MVAIVGLFADEYYILNIKVTGEERGLQLLYLL
jgi:hypothetical protein